jgi:large subunit ribosomal protein L23
MSKNILIKPLITEKAEKISEKGNRYSFVVDKKANKLEIKKAVEEMYKVSITDVNTLVMPAKIKSRSSRSGVIQGRKSSFKKAIVTVVKGEEIDFFGDL